MTAVKPIRRLFVLGALLVACGGPRTADPAPPRDDGTATATAVDRDLVRDFPAAIPRRELATLDLGTAAARPHLLSGWGHDEREGEGSFVWGLGEVSELEFYATGPAEVILGLHCRTLTFEGAPEQTVSVAVNGLEVATVEVGESPGRHRVRLPAAALRRGTNRLRFTYRYHRRPRDVLPGAEDERSLAVRWEAVDFLGLASAGPPRLAATGDRLEIPVGSEISYYFDFRPGSELVIGGLHAWGGGDGVRLRATMETAAGETSRLLDPGHLELPLRLPLPVTAPALGRLTLAATREGTAEGALRRWWRRISGAGAGMSLLLPMVMAEAAGREAPAGPAPEPEVPPEPRRPDVLVYLIDTLRADHLGLYGYHRPTSPEIDRFAEDALTFADARAQSSWTRSSVVSLMTGLLPQVHGVNRRDDALGRSVDTLAEILAAAGYETAGFITNGNVAADFGLDQGFDLYRYLQESRREPVFHQLSDRLNRRVFPWLEERAGRRDDRRPFFLYLHTTDPHAPYTPPEPFRSRFAPEVDPEAGWIERVHDISAGRASAPEGTAADFIDLYDGEIAWNDHHFGRLLARLRALDLYDSTLIVLLSDHGEEFREHGGWEHGKTLYREQLRIPLVIKLPGGEEAGREIGVPADQVDVLPTILDYLGVESAAPLDGRSLLPLLRSADAANGGGTPSFAYLLLEQKRMRSVAARGWKLIVDDSAHLRGGARELYRLTDDPEERRDLFADRPLEWGFLEQTLSAFEQDLRRGTRRFEVEQAEIDDELRRRLEALGYVN